MMSIDERVIRMDPPLGDRMLALVAAMLLTWLVLCATVCLVATTRHTGDGVPVVGGQVM